MEAPLGETKASELGAEDARNVLISTPSLESYPSSWQGQGALKSKEYMLSQQHNEATKHCAWKGLGDDFTVQKLKVQRDKWLPQSARSVLPDYLVVVISKTAGMKR